ncbi:hypothetical protein HD806DRAFT_486289 [Xylariaceae sp. AK1471]|nr:hypothetical protein HD806DRAFT_486289 [Xylariaceae sp. AK1471]
MAASKYLPFSLPRYIQEPLSFVSTPTSGNLTCYTLCLSRLVFNIRQVPYIFKNRKRLAVLRMGDLNYLVVISTQY